MKEFIQFDALRAAVFICLHDLAHIAPPFTTDLSLRDSLPTRLTFNFYIGKELIRFRMQRDRVVVNSVGFQGLLEVRPQVIMPLSVFSFAVRLELHYKRLPHNYFLF